MRVFPLSNWTELDVWEYLDLEGLEVPSIYFAHQRKVFKRDGMLYAWREGTELIEGEEVFSETVRYRTVGDMSCTGGVRSRGRHPARGGPRDRLHDDHRARRDEGRRPRLGGRHGGPQEGGLLLGPPGAGPLGSASQRPILTGPAPSPAKLPRPVFSKVLIANRGEIAIRIVRALEELGIESVAVYSELDKDALHAGRADESYNLGPGPAAENYLSIEKILDVAARSGAEAIHPGYGFLAENAAFAQACEDAGIVFIGPPASAIEAMGSKTRARELMKAAGVPIVPGTTEPVADAEEALKIASEQIGFPVAVKAAGGGGGKGFRVALTEEELPGAFEGSSREGEKFFSDPTVYLERYLPDPRHVEVQVLADTHGNVIHLGERDCSIQRRHQKLIEESPAPEWIVDEEMRERIGQIGVEAARAVDYVGAGTIEGLFVAGSSNGAKGSGEAEYFFLEMNTRVQVEHCVTEMTTGIDIVKEGIRAAAGEPLSYSQEDVVLRGHAIECRINAEDASKNFAPAPGAIGRYREPTGPGVRVDSGVGEGGEVSPMYDPMVAKLIVWDADREQATKRMLRALGEYEIERLKTLIPFHQALLAASSGPAGRPAGTCSRTRRG